MDTLTGDDIMFPSYTECVNNPLVGKMVKEIQEKYFKDYLEKLEQTKEQRKLEA